VSKDVSSPRLACYAERSLASRGDLITAWEERPANRTTWKQHRTPQILALIVIASLSHINDVLMKALR
jgi:hypothetical protein